MAAPTLSNLISESFFELGIYSPGETVDPTHVNWAAERLNAMIDSWKAERLTIYREQRLGPFNLSSSTQTYTIGSGATWNTARPIWVDAAGLVQTVGSGTPVPEFPLQILTDMEWARVSIKALTSSLPTALWYDRTYTADGYGTIYMWPIPTVANQVALYAPVPVNEFTLPDDLTSAIVFPPGYRDFIMYSLAIRIGPTFGKRASEVTISLRNESMEKVKTSNFRLNMLRVDNALLRREGGTWNWLNDSFSFRSW